MIEQIDIQKDIKEFIELNESHINLPDEIQYIPYSIMLRSKPVEQQNYPTEAVYNAIVAIQSALNLVKESEYVKLINLCLKV